MLFIQKYFSLQDIESEFQEPLEQLMGQDVPGFQWLLLQDKNLKSDYIPLYFLFFCKSHNRPVGFCQINLYPFSFDSFLTWSEKLIIKLKRKNVAWKILSNEINGLIGKGTIFHPHFQKEGLLTLKKLVADLHQQYDIAMDILNFDDEIVDINFEKGEYSFERNIPWVLYKSFKDYRSYLNSLNEKIRKESSLIWKGTFQKFDSIEEAMREIPPDTIESEKVEKFQLGMNQLKGEYYLLSENGNFKALVIMIDGQAGNLFAYFCYPKGVIAKSGPEQFAIGLFFEREDCHRLHFPPPPHLKNQGEHLNFLESLNVMGLTTKKRWASIHPCNLLVEKNWSAIKQLHLPHWNSWAKF